jgi:hypothetical protein
MIWALMLIYTAVIVFSIPFIYRLYIAHGKYIERHEELDILLLYFKRMIFPWHLYPQPDLPKDRGKRQR